MIENKKTFFAPKFEVLIKAIDELEDILKAEIQAISNRDFFFTKQILERKSDIVNFLSVQKTNLSKVAIKDYYNKEEIRLLSEKFECLKDVSEKNLVELDAASLLNRHTIDTLNGVMKKAYTEGATYSSKGELRELKRNQTYGFGGEV
jgi:flagellar biosynthesis/type III secretory pathway chaperone